MAVALTLQHGPVDPQNDSALRARLAHSHVSIVGCGGLGSNIAAMLVRSGVGELTLIDFDRVEESNLNRQLYFRDQLGLPKVEVLAQTLRRIDPSIRLRLHQECIDAENLVGLLGTPDVVIEAVDRAATKGLICNVVLAEIPDVPLVSASGLAGIDSANDITTQRVGQTFYLVGDLCSDVTLGHSLLASRVMAAAAHQAHAAIRLLLGYPEP